MWLVYAISAAAVWGLDYALGERTIKKISPVSLMALQMVLGGIVFSAIGWTQDLKRDVSLLLAEPSTLFLSIATMASFNLGNFLIFLSIQAKNATLAGLVELCYPLFTALFAYLLFKDYQVNLGTLIGGAFILAGIALISFTTP